MEQENFSPQDSIAVIQDMIAKAKNNIGDNSTQLLLWGWVTFAAFISQFLLKNVADCRQHYLVWMVIVPAAIVSTYIGKKQKRAYKATGYIQDAMGYLWMGMGISFFVLCVIFSKLGWGSNIYPFFILMYGLGTFVSGKLLQFTPLVAGGIAAWLLAVAASFVAYDYQMLLGAAAIMASYIIPAHILHKTSKSENTNK
jgi:hypothetical protein